MAGNTITRADLIDVVVRKGKVSRYDAQGIVELVLEEVSATVENGETVKLSSFGSFMVREKSERVGRNPKTGEEKLITPRRVVTFRASNIMKQRVNSGLKRLYNKKRGEKASDGDVVSKVATAATKAASLTPGKTRAGASSAKSVAKPKDGPAPNSGVHAAE